MAACQLHKKNLYSVANRSPADSNVTGEYPAAGDLRQMIAQKPIPQLAEDILKHEPTGPGYAIDQARLVVSQLATSLTSGDAETLANCFFTTQAYWKDNLALTSHLRTFESSKVVAKSLVQTSTLRGGIDSLELVESSVVLIPATPTLVSISLLERLKNISSPFFCKTALYRL